MRCERYQNLKTSVNHHRLIIFVYSLHIICLSRQNEGSVTHIEIHSSWVLRPTNCFTLWRCANPPLKILKLCFNLLRKLGIFLYYLPFFILQISAKNHFFPHTHSTAFHNMFYYHFTQKIAQVSDENLLWSQTGSYEKSFQIYVSSSDTFKVKKKTMRSGRFRLQVKWSQEFSIN